MSDPPGRYIGGMDRPDWHRPDDADIRDAADDAHHQDDTARPELWPDVEWSTDQTFVGEFGHTNQFGDPIE